MMGGKNEIRFYILRKNINILVSFFQDSVLFALAYLCLAAAQNVWMLFLGRVLCGIACGITTIAAPTYVSEVSSPKIRGTLGSCFQLMVTIGVLYTVRILHYLQNVRA